MLEYFPHMLKSLKPLPDVNSLDNIKAKVRVSTAIKVVQQANVSEVQKRCRYTLMLMRNFVTVFVGVVLNYLLGYHGALMGMGVAAYDAYSTYHSHRLTYDRTPSPFLAGAFLAGIFFTSLVSLQLVFSNPTLTLTSQSWLTSFIRSWYFQCYVIVMIGCLWYLYIRIMLRGSRGANYGCVYTGRMWDMGKFEMFDVCVKFLKSWWFQRMTSIDRTGCVCCVTQWLPPTGPSTADCVRRV